MRPTQLEVEGFTSFRERQSVSFHKYGLFAIIGPTGSGKTSILDAICFALFGAVPRVNKHQLRELVTLGMAQARVQLDFTVGGDQYRVARRLPRSGATSVVVEKQVDDEFRTAVDQGGVRAADRYLEDLIGLDFAAFTRAVMLPQGAFHQFLTGAAADRRQIITRLLELERYEKAGKLAREHERELSDGVAARRAVIDEEFGDATIERLSEVKRALSASERKFKAAEALKKEVDALARKASDLSSSRSALTAELNRLSDVDARLSKLGEEWKNLGPAIKRAEKGRREATANLRKASKERKAADESLERTLQRVGDEQAVASLRSLCRDFESIKTRIKELQGQFEAKAKEERELARQIPEVEKSIKQFEGEHASLQRKLKAGRETLSTLERENLAGALRSDLQVGDNCPVCGNVIRKLHPDRSDDQAIKDTKKSIATLEESIREVNGDLGAAREELVQVRTRMDGFDEARQNLQRNIKREDERRAEVLDGIGALFEDGVPEDFDAAVEERDTTLKDARRASRAAFEAEQAAAEHLRKCNTAVDKESQKKLEIDRTLTTLITEARLSEDVRGKLPEEGVPAVPARAETIEEDLQGLESYLTSVRTMVKDAKLKLEAEKKEVAEALALKIDEAQLEHVDDEPETLIRTVDEYLQSTRDKSKELKLLKKDVDRRIEQRKRLEEGIEKDKRKAALYKSLASELRADRFLAFVLEESLDLLADSASIELRSISGGRYSLDCKDGDFVVIDHINADEKRSVATLSGGETFLASLSLALALSSSMTELSGTTSASKLDAIFIDEGFGTLDAETLDVVVDALERLQEGDRMVGVISHVPALAERMPSVIQVEKVAGGARIVSPD